MQADLAKIVWPTTPALRDTKVWERNIAIVWMLTEHCIVTEWLRGRPGKDEYLGMPYKYSLESVYPACGVTIEFLPHWRSILVGGASFQIPNSWRELMQAVEAILKPQRLAA